MVGSFKVSLVNLLLLLTNSSFVVIHVFMPIYFEFGEFLRLLIVRRYKLLSAPLLLLLDFHEARMKFIFHSGQHPESLG